MLPYTEGMSVYIACCTTSHAHFQDINAYCIIIIVWFNHYKYNLGQRDRSGWEVKASDLSATLAFLGLNPGRAHGFLIGNSLQSCQEVWPPETEQKFSVVRFCSMKVYRHFYGVISSRLFFFQEHKLMALNLQDKQAIIAELSEVLKSLSCTTVA